MNKRKTFACIFAGVMLAGLLVLGAALIVRAVVTGNSIVTVVTFFAIIAGSIMAGLGLISMLICLFLLLFGKSKKQRSQEEQGDDLGKKN